MDSAMVVPVGMWATRSLFSREMVGWFSPLMATMIEGSSMSRKVSMAVFRAVVGRWRVIWPFSLVTVGCSAPVGSLMATMPAKSVMELKARIACLAVVPAGRWITVSEVSVREMPSGRVKSAERKVMWS